MGPGAILTYFNDGRVREIFLHGSEILAKVIFLGL